MVNLIVSFASKFSFVFFIGQITKEKASSLQADLLGYRWGKNVYIKIEADILNKFHREILLSFE